MLSLYRKPDLDLWIFYCFLASMGAMQTEDIRASFLFVGDLNGHRQEWLGPIPPQKTVMELLLLTLQPSPVVICCMVVSPTHSRGGTLDLLMTDVPDLVRVAVVASIGNADYSILSVGSHFDGSGGSILVC